MFYRCSYRPNPHFLFSSTQADETLLHYQTWSQNLCKDSNNALLNSVTFDSQVQYQSSIVDVREQPVSSESTQAETRNQPSPLEPSINLARMHPIDQSLNAAPESVENTQARKRHRTSFDEDVGLIKLAPKTPK
jgi:hypothetical protein